MLKIGVLISGGGSNLQAIIDSISNGYIKAEISIVVSNKIDAYGLERAGKSGIYNKAIERGNFSSVEEFEEEIATEFKKKNVDLVVLAGWIRPLSHIFVNQFKDKIINIHPALIPSFCGKGFYGIHVHEAVIKNGNKISGATVHFVNQGIDTGAIILQESCPVYFEDSPDDLQKRVLVIEHKLLPEAVKLIVESRIEVVGNRVKIL